MTQKELNALAPLEAVLSNLTRIEFDYSFKYKAVSRIEGGKWWVLGKDGNYVRTARGNDIRKFASMGAAIKFATQPKEQ